MLVYAVSDIPAKLDLLCDVISNSEASIQIKAFLHPFSAFNALMTQDQLPSVIFTEINMTEMNGLELARLMLQEVPWLNIIFITDTEVYARQAFLLHASGYLLYPVTSEDIREELCHLRSTMVRDTSKRIQVQTFGNFDVRIDGQPVKFKHNKTLEYLAYLIDKGTLCTNKEIAMALWEKEVDSSYIRRLRKDLIDTFHEAGCEDVIVRQPKKQGIVREEISCDYYDWLKGIPRAVQAYRGEYMAQYSWAELIHGPLE